MLQPNNSIAKKEDLVFRETTCPACGYQIAVPFFSGGNQPLATLAWPASETQAQAMPRLPLDFVRCVHCGHIFNTAFRYEDVPYSEKPNLMFNKGRAWSEFIRELQERICSVLPENPCVVEIGHGDGSFLHGLSQIIPKARIVGFDPHGACGMHRSVIFRTELFKPEIHLKELAPDMIISRHVLEHLVNPVGFLQSIAFCACRLGRTVEGYFEAPCIDRVLSTGRTVDLYYEHSSQFTTRSFSIMLNRCEAEILTMEHSYDGEVISAFLRLGNKSISKTIAQEAEQYQRHARESLGVIKKQLEALSQSGRTVVIWGGTGKSAAFMNRYGCDSTRFPLVVDSDLDKVRSHVPGTGQTIRFRDELKGRRVDVVLIPPQWRAKDIVKEMSEIGIDACTILIEHQGRLIDFRRDDHPYARP
jgi:hypothetical protein